MNIFKQGDRVTLTRRSRGGRVFTLTGTLTSVSYVDGELSSGAIHGRAAGKPEHSHFDLAGGRMLRLYGVTQTLTHAEVQL